MAEPLELIKARLIELDADLEREKSGGKQVDVQINPESVKLAFANQVAQPQNAGDPSGTQSRQHVGAGTMKLTFQLWFDATGELPAAKQGVADVRELTADVIHFITPIPNRGGSSAPAAGGSGSGGSQAEQMIPPGVRFIWGTFSFDGIMDSVDESLEYWSHDGKPLRASMSIAMSRQRIVRRPAGAGGPLRPPGAGAPAGTNPLTPAPAGATLQGLAEAAGAGANWQQIAAANGIENPRALAPGQLVDLSIRVELGLGGA